MNSLKVTVTGWVATDPRHVVGPTGTRLTSFRMASTARNYDATRSEWIDGKTVWMTVRTFSEASLNVVKAVEKGQPVIVTGRLHTHEWDSDNGTRIDLIIDADALGHDLTKGVATFTRTHTTPIGGDVEPVTETADETADAN